MGATAQRRARLALSAGPDSARQGRRFVQQQLTAWGLDGLVDDVSLVTTELVTNAVLHARSELEVVIEMGERVRLEVHDRSVEIPAVRSAAGLMATGRGLRLVELLASTWGAQPTTGGKLIWCEFADPTLVRGTSGARAVDGTPGGGADQAAGARTFGRRLLSRRPLLRRLVGREVA